IVYAGSPAVPVRSIARDELARCHAALRTGGPLEADADAHLPPLAQPVPLSGVARPARHSATFVAPTASLAGLVEMAEDAGIYFACVVDAGDAGVALGAGTNVQAESFVIT